MTSAARLARRLRRAREECGLSQQKVADALGLPRTALSKIEGGTRAVSTLELTRLGDLYAFPAAYFLAEDRDPAAEDAVHVLLRAVPEMKRDPEVGKAVRSSVTLYREGASLRRLLGRPVEPAIPNYAAAMASTSDALRQGEAVAAEERRRLGLGDVPISGVAGLVSDQGIWVDATHLPDGLSGVFVNHPTIGFGVLLNRRYRTVRQRFACVHEYAHALFDRARTVTASRAENASGRSEMRANAFAAAFLMPPAGVTRHLRRIGKGRSSRHPQTIFDVANDTAAGAVVRERPRSQKITYADVAELARHFKVSFEATVWRLESLRHTSTSDSAGLLQQSDVGGRLALVLDGTRTADDGVGEASQAAPEAGVRHRTDDGVLRGQLVHLAIEAFRQEAISRGRLLEIARKLDIADDDMLDLAWAARPY